MPDSRHPQVEKIPSALSGNQRSLAARIRGRLLRATERVSAAIWELRWQSLLDARPARHRGPSRRYRQYVLLSHQRSGSTLILSTLRRHPQIVAFSELFNPARVSFRTEGYDDASKPLLHLRNKMPLEFLERQIFSSYPEDIRAVGFKVFPDQLENAQLSGVWDWLARNRDIKVIFLKRRNLLARYASLRIASETRQYNIKDESERTDATVTLGFAECLAEFRRREVSNESAWQRLAGHEVVEIIYEELIEDFEGAFRRLQSFLEVEALPLSVATLRKEVRPLSQVITNYDDLERQFRGSQWEHFFRE